MGVFKKEKGVTLVALVVTIIVLLILAGITIGAITGDNGIINQTQDAKAETERAQWEEKIDSAIIDAENKHTNPTLDDVIDELIIKDIIDEASDVNRETGEIKTKPPSYVIEGKLDNYVDKEEPTDPDPEEPVVAEHTVTYNYSANGGNRASKTSEKLEEGKSIDLTVTANKTGYQFVGWNKDRNAEKGIDSLTMGSQDITLYAIYKKDIVGTFKYWTGTSTSSTTRTTTIYNTETQGKIVAPAISNTSKNGTTYTAKGWSGTDDGNASVAVNQGETVTISGNTTYYAIYSGTTTATFYYYNGSKQTSAPGNAATTMNSSGKETTGTMSVPDEVTRSSGPYGTKYAGVATSTNSTTSATVNSSNTTYYAFYSVPITYYFGNGSYTTTNRKAMSNGSSYVTAVDNDYKPSNYDSATFKTWSTSSSSEVAVSPSSTSQTTLYAVYERTISVRFNYYGGYNSTYATSNGTRTYISNSYSINQYDGTVSIPSSVTSSSGPGDTNYAFVSTSSTATNGMTPTTASPATYYAIYKNDITITKRYYYNQISYAYGTAYGYYNGRTQPAIIDLGTLSYANGYTFRGWSTSSSANEQIESSNTISTTTNKTYYASYYNNVTVSYNLNGAGGSINPQYVQTYMNYLGSTSGGGSVKLADRPSGGTTHAFVNWNTASTGYGTPYQPGQVIYPTQDMTLFAVWYEASIPSTLTANAGETIKITIGLDNISDITSYKIYKASTATGDGVLASSRAFAMSSGNRIIITIQNVISSDEGYYYLVLTTRTYGDDVKIETSRCHMTVI